MKITRPKTYTIKDVSSDDLDVLTSALMFFANAPLNTVGTSGMTMARRSDDMVRATEMRAMIEEAQRHEYEY